MAEANQPPLSLDLRDPRFARNMFDWSRQMIHEMNQTVLAAQETITTSKALMAKADRIIAWR